MGSRCRDLSMGVMFVHSHQDPGSAALYLIRSVLQSGGDEGGDELFCVRKGGGVVEFGNVFEMEEWWFTQMFDVSIKCWVTHTKVETVLSIKRRLGHVLSLEAQNSPQVILNGQSLLHGRWNRNPFALIQTFESHPDLDDCESRPASSQNQAFGVYLSHHQVKGRAHPEQFSVGVTWIWHTSEVADRLVLFNGVFQQIRTSMDLTSSGDSHHFFTNTVFTLLSWFRVTLCFRSLFWYVWRSLLISCVTQGRNSSPHWPIYGQHSGESTESRAGKQHNFGELHAAKTRTCVFSHVELCCCILT